MKPLLSCAFLVAALLAPDGIGRGLAVAQQPMPPAEPPGPGEAEQLARDIAIHLMTLAETNEVAASNEVSQLGEALSPANASPSADPVAERQTSSGRDYARDRERDRDRSSYRRSSREFPGSSHSSGDEAARAPGQSAPYSSDAPAARNSQGRPDFSNFRLIADRNIFDPNRRASRASAPRERPKSVETLSLVGVMRYEKGTFAFFDGSSSAYRKALRESDTIAGHRLAAINSTAVTLAAGTNQFELRVGAQLRREDEGGWTLSRQTETFAAANPAANHHSTSTTSTDSASSGGGDSDVLKRLRERRERE